MSKKDSVTVSLAGHKFSIKSEHNEAHLEQLAAYVDRKVRELQRMSKSVGTQQLALLAAMNIADELFQAQDAQRQFRQRVARKSEHLLKVVDLAMANRAAASSAVPVPVSVGAPATKAGV